MFVTNYRHQLLNRSEYIPMKVQNYGNHKRYYIPHHVVFYSCVALSFFACMYQGLAGCENQGLWLMLGFAFLLIGALSFMLRQHYSLGNQRRIIRLEMRLRYYQLTQKRFDPIEARLSLAQVFALRFASDEELLPLIDRAINENLSPDEIKRAVKNWQPDHLRV